MLTMTPAPLSAINRAAARDNQRNLAAEQVGRQLRHEIVLSLGPAEVDEDILPLYIAGLPQSLAKRGNQVRERSGRPAVQKPNDRLLLRTRRDRPSGHAAEKGDEIASSHCRPQGRGPRKDRVNVGLRNSRSNQEIVTGGIEIGRAHV